MIKTIRSWFGRCGKAMEVAVYLLLAVLKSQWSLQAQPSAFPQPEVITSQNGLPQGFVPSILQDRQGFIWMATRGGLCRYDGQLTKVFQNDIQGRPSLSSNTLTRLRLDPQGNIWILSENATLDRFDPVTEQFFRFDNHPAIAKYRPGGTINDFIFDKQGNIWISFYRQGLLCIHRATNRSKWVPFHADFLKETRNPIGVIFQPDDRGQVCVLTQDSVVRYDERRHALVPYRQDNHDPDLSTFRPQFGLLSRRTNQLRVMASGTHSIRSFLMPDPVPHDLITPIAFDSQGFIYAENNGKLMRCSESGKSEVVYDFSRESWRPMSLYIDRSDVLWLGTDGFGIRKFNLRKPPFEAIPYQKGFLTDWLTIWAKVPPNRQPVLASSASQYYFRNALDRTGKMLWYTHGFPPVIHRLNTISKEVKSFPLPMEGTRRSNIYPVTRDPDGILWVLVENQLVRFDEPSETWQKSGLSVDWDRMGTILQLVADRQFFWICTKDNGLFRLDRKTRQLQSYHYNPKDSTSLSSNRLYCLFADPAEYNRLWIGTYGGGLCAFDKRTGQSRRLTTREGLPNNVIYSAIPDRHGYLWIGTDKGLCQMNRQTFQTRTYTTKDGILADEFNRFHFAQFPNDYIIMAGVEGFTSFQPSELREDSYHPQVELTGLQINNRPVVPGAHSPLGDTPVQGAQQLTLPHNQNFITAEFVALQFNQTNLNRYRYQLQGVDATWIETTRPEAVYTELRPGTYTLALNGSNTSGNWSRYVRTLSIRILPPFWATWWAYLVYGFFIAGTVFWGFRLYANRLKLRQSIVLQQKEAEQLRAMDEIKNRFFSNITHEFRTPLTLILTPAQQLKPRLDHPDDQRRLAAIDRNAHQLLELVNQLLVISKLEAGALPVVEVRSNLDSFVRQIIQNFEPPAHEKNVQLLVSAPRFDSEYWFDADKLERILYNLLSNALKFTPEGGRVAVEFRISEPAKPTSNQGELHPVNRQPDAPHWFVLTVTDTGIGIDAEQLPRIFDRFYQATHISNSFSNHPPTGSSSVPGPAGTGIGLALVKELVDVLQGQIQVESQTDTLTENSGTCFTISIPLRPVMPSAAIRPELATPIPTPLPGEESRMSDEVPSVLLVEDNAELALYIAESLPAHYRITKAENGRIGFELAAEQIPDLIISDVLMPEMDGYSLCHYLKTDLRTSHIPVVLLTAKSAFEDRVEGLSLGADDYISKPFHVRELQLRVHNLLEGRRRQREWVRSQLNSLEEPVLEAPIAPLDPFLEKLYAIIEKKLDDSLFGVEALSDQMGISRVQVYRKIKALTGLTATELLRNYRLKRACQYLREGYSVGETGNLVGFDTPAYFTKCFRELYHMTPTEFMARQ